MRYLLRRLLHSFILLLVTVSFVFFAGRSIGDPALNILGVNATEQALETLRANIGLNDPLYIQYFRFLGDVVQGDFGVSYRFGFSVVPAEALRDGLGTPVLPLVLDRLPATFFLAGTAMALALSLAIAMGIAAAVWPRSAIDRLVTVLSLAGVSVVQFWLGLMLIVLFGVNLGWLPTTGYGGLEFVILPALTLAAPPHGTDRPGRAQRDARRTRKAVCGSGPGKGRFGGTDRIRPLPEERRHSRCDDHGGRIVGIADGSDPR